MVPTTLRASIRSYYVILPSMPGASNWYQLCLVPTMHFASAMPYARHARGKHFVSAGMPLFTLSKGRLDTMSFKPIPNYMGLLFILRCGPSPTQSYWKVLQHSIRRAHHHQTLISAKCPQMQASADYSSIAGIQQWRGQQNQRLLSQETECWGTSQEEGTTSWSTPDIQAVQLLEWRWRAVHLSAPSVILAISIVSLQLLLVSAEVQGTSVLVGTIAVE